MEVIEVFLAYPYPLHPLSRSVVIGKKKEEKNVLIYQEEKEWSAPNFSGLAFELWPEGSCKCYIFKHRFCCINYLIMCII